jgi:CRISPR system Cascade subunit CasA
VNLLSDPWIPVRLQAKASAQKLTLQQLLCGNEKWELCLPRDDMELAALQLLVCLAQALATPESLAELRQRIINPLTAEQFAESCKPYEEWFQLDHPRFPFMQVRGVEAKDPTPMDKLLAGVTGATNSCFVNQPGLAEALCSSCTAVALFNQAMNVPGFGGGFKASLRGSAPVTTLVQGEHLRQTVWLNVLSRERVESLFPWHGKTGRQKMTWIEPIRSETFSAQSIGFLRGLFWQPAHVELLPAESGGNCSCCGQKNTEVYRGFNKAKFNYTVTGVWPHPHGARITTLKKGEQEEKFVSFTTEAPAWTQLGRFVVMRAVVDSKIPGQEPAAVIRQVQELGVRLTLCIGGYRNNQASILERRHEQVSLGEGWNSKPQVVQEVVDTAIGYRDALNKALFTFYKGGGVKGVGLPIHEAGRMQYYRRTEDVILDTLARLNFDKPAPSLLALQIILHHTVKGLFEESVQSYLNDPNLVHTMAVSRRVLRKHLNDLKPQKEELVNGKRS